MRISLLKPLTTIFAVGAISVVGIGGTFANFTATPTTIENNVFTAGTLVMTRSGTGVIFNAGNVKIGQTVTGSVTINNTGTLPGAYTLSGTTTGSSTLSGQLNVKVYKDNDNVAGSKLYDGTLAAFSSLSLGEFAASTGSHTFYFHVTLPTTGTDAGDNALQGLSTSTTFTWNATQV